VGKNKNISTLLATLTLPKSGQREKWLSAR